MQQDSNTLGADEQAALDALEDQLGRGVNVHWPKHEPKTIRGYGARDIETVSVPSYDDPSQMVEKRVATIRTSEGLQAIWEGPAGLEKLFESEIAGRPVIVTCTGEKISQKTGRSYKAFTVLVGDAPASDSEDISF